jgi:hypothetical protein
MAYIIGLYKSELEVWLILKHYDVRAKPCKSTDSNWSCLVVEYHPLALICLLLIQGCTYLPALCNLLAPPGLYQDSGVADGLVTQIRTSAVPFRQQIIKVGSLVAPDYRTVPLQRLRQRVLRTYMEYQPSDTGYLCLHAHSGKGLVNYRNAK